MRAFIVLALIALARADVGGYNYEANNGGGGAGGVGSGSTGGIGGGFGGFGGAVGNFGGSGGSVGGFGGSGSVVGGGASGNFGGNSGIAHHAVHHDAPAELEKEFYTFTAPEAEFEDSQPLHDLASSLKKNLQVIFIKGPENNGLTNAALNLAKSATDSKTAIYVLTKQADAADLANKLKNEHNHQANKPEVHFVKYRTPEDAHNAQHAIQSQYDQLGGLSKSHNGGVAKVLDFASKPAVHQQQHHGDGGAGVVAPSTSYIPPQVPSKTYLPNLKF